MSISVIIPTLNAEKELPALLEALRNQSLRADEILVVRDGRIVERGTHKDLVHAGGTYQELYETQFSKAEA